MTEINGNLADVAVVYEQEEYYVQAAVEPNEGINVELLQCQILSLLGVLPGEQILVSSHGEVITSPFSAASLALQWLPVSSPGKPERLFVVNAADAKAADERVSNDWREICTRCTFGDIPVVQPAFRVMGADALVCEACATTCGTDSMAVSPLQWQETTKLAESFISEIFVVAGEPDVPTPRGFTKIPGDLNYSSSGDFVHLFIKRGGTRAITQVQVNHQLRTEATIKCLGTVVAVDCNSGSASDTAVLLSYDTIAMSAHEALNTFAITDLELVVGAASASPGFVKITKNLNQGNEGAEGLFLSYKVAALGSFACAASHGAFGECLFLGRHAGNLASGPVVASGCSPRSDAALAELESSRERADSSFLEQHYRQHMPGMESRLAGGIARVKTYENPSVQAEALKRIPVETLHERARANSEPLASYQDELAMQLTHWFKREFFTWMNQPKCVTCSNEKTRIVRTDPPSTPEEIAGQAGRVEVYQCPQCRGFTRFPRYNDPVKLLETRTGRCGEWANCFTLCCRAMGFEARYVLDVTDHVWTEVYSEHHKRWLHCDSCEDQLDQPLTYEVGWGKKLSYIFSFSHEEVVDTAQRYTQNWGDMKLRRSEVSETWLASTTENLNRDLRRSLSAARISILDGRAVREQAEFEQGRKASAEEAQGRVSGSIEWKSERQEDGTNDESEPTASASVSHSISATSEHNKSSAELIQSFAKSMLLGCDRGSECNNPNCMHKRVLMAPSMSPTDRAAKTLQDVATIQARNFSIPSLASLLCPSPGDIRDFVLSHEVELYLPAQDSETVKSLSALVDISGNGHHGSTDAPLRKPFRIPGSDGKVQLYYGIQLLPGRKLSARAPRFKNHVLSWLARFDEQGGRSSSLGIALSIRFLGTDDSTDASIIVRYGCTSEDFVVEVSSKDGVVAQAQAWLSYGAYYHFSVAVIEATQETIVYVNAEELMRAQSSFVGKIGGSFIFESDAVSAELPARVIPVVTHVAMLAVADEEEVLRFNDSFKERFVCWPPLQPYDCSGARPDKSCNLQASLQSGYRVSRVRLWGSEFFDGIQLVYEKPLADGTATTVDGPLIGNRNACDGSRTPTIEFALLPSEYLVKVGGRKGAWMDCIRLVTNFERQITCGGPGGGDFEVKFPSISADQPIQIRAIEFDVGDHLVDAVAFVAQAPRDKSDDLLVQLRQIFQNVVPSKQQASLSAVTRYLENIVSSPNDPKLQKIRSSNKFFTSSIGALGKEDQTALMKWCGFNGVTEGGESFYTLDISSTSTDFPASAFAAMRLYYIKASLKK